MTSFPNFSFLLFYLDAWSQSHFIYFFLSFLLFFVLDSLRFLFLIILIFASFAFFPHQISISSFIRDTFLSLHYFIIFCWFLFQGFYYIHYSPSTFWLNLTLFFLFSLRFFFLSFLIFLIPFLSFFYRFRFFSFLFCSSLVFILQTIRKSTLFIFFYGLLIPNS